MRQGQTKFSRGLVLIQWVYSVVQALCDRTWNNGRRRYWSGTVVQSACTPWLLIYHSPSLRYGSTDTTLSSWISTSSFTPFRFPFALTVIPPWCACFGGKIDRCKAEDSEKEQAYLTNSLNTDQIQVQVTLQLTVSQSVSQSVSLPSRSEVIVIQSNKKLYW